MKNHSNLDFDELYNKYVHLVFHIAVNFVTDQYIAEDIVQEVFLRLSRNLPRIQSMEHAKAWLMSVTSNVCIDYFRKKGKEQILIENMQEVFGDSEDMIEKRIAQWDNEVLVEHILEMLYRKNRRWYDITIDAVYGQKTNEELAEKYHISPNAMSSLQYRIHKWMKKELQKQLPELKNMFKD